jgi:type I restriction enzyme S subunit
MVFNITDKATPDYLVNLLHTGNFLKYASSTMVGVNHPRTNWASLKEFKVSLPPLPEQRRIAAVLTAIQEAIAAQDDVITAARAFKRSLMQRLFTYGPGREPAETKETEIGKIPAHWEVVCLGDLVDVRGGKRLPKGSLYSENITNHPYIRVVDFADFSVDRSDLKYISEETYKQISRYIITSDDVYISNAGTIGLVGTIPQELSGGNLTENAARLIIKEKRKLDKFYLSQWLGFDFGQAQIQVRTTKTSQPKLALMRIQQIPLALPNISEQEKIANALLTVDAKIAAEEDRQASLQAFFQSTLHHLMTGQIRLLHDKGLPL